MEEEDLEVRMVRKYIFGYVGGGRCGWMFGCVWGMMMCKGAFLNGWEGWEGWVYIRILHVWIRLVYGVVGMVHVVSTHQSQML